MKKLRNIVVVLVGLVIALAVVFVTSVDYALERAIESYGSEALGTSVNVGSVTIRFAEGKGTVRGLRVSQPDGFGFGDVVALDEITLDLDVQSLIDADPYRVELARVTSPQIVYVIGKDGRSNLAALKANLERYSASGEATTAPDGEPSDVRMRVDRLEIEAGSIDADLSTFGLGQTTARWPAMRVSDIGGERGVPPGKVASTVGIRFMSHTLSAVASSGIGRSLDGIVDQGSKAVRGLFDKLRGS